MSLADVQNKLVIYYVDHQFSLPLGAAPSTHILKPNNDNKQFPYCPANEFFCMQLAKAMGYLVPDTYLMHLPEPIYLVKRYDRHLVKKDNSVERLHQIDLCQFLNKWSG